MEAETLRTVWGRGKVYHTVKKITYFKGLKGDILRQESEAGCLIENYSPDFTLP